MAGEAEERNVAVLFGEDIGKPRREAVIVEAPVEQGEGERQRIIVAGFPKGGQGVVIAGDEIARLESCRKAEGKILLIAAAKPYGGIGIGGDVRFLPVGAQLQLKESGGGLDIGYLRLDRP
jgi:hypothetical protein